MLSIIQIFGLSHSTPSVPIFVLYPMGSCETFFKNDISMQRACDQPPLVHAMQYSGYGGCRSAYNTVRYKILEGENFGELPQNRQNFLVQNFLH